VQIQFPARDSLAHSDNDLPSRASGLEIPHGFGGFFERIGSVDNGREFAGFDRSHQKRQILVRLVVDRLVLAEYYSNTLRVEEEAECRR
jgi:hypothetical protein